MTQKYLTIKQALNEGYSLCGRICDETYTRLEDLTEEELKEMIESTCDDNGDCRGIFLANKYCSIDGFPDEENILDYIDESIERCEYGLESTTECIQEFKEDMKTLLGNIQQKIHDTNATHTYELTEIQLKLRHGQKI